MSNHCISYVFGSPVRIYQLIQRVLFHPPSVDIRAIPYGASVIAISCMLSTYYLASVIFSALADAEVTYHRRFLYVHVDAYWLVFDLS